MIDKVVDHAPRACVDIVWHVHVLRMFTEREQDELVNNTTWLQILVRTCLAFANQYPDGDNR
jgi:hypothetical protein